MSDDFALQMYEAQAELVETKQELEKVRRENDELKNQITATHLMKTVDDFQRNNFNRLKAMETNLRTLTTTVFSNHDTFAEMKETLKDLNERIQTLKENEKNLVYDHTRLSEIVREIQVNVTTLSTKVSSSDKILSAINETLKKQNDTLEKQNKIIEVLRKNMKKIEKNTIFLLGGGSGCRKMDSLLILQNNGENDGNWKELNIKLPYPIWCHGAQLLNNYLYIFGGQNEKNEVLNSTYKLTGGHKLLSNSLQWDKRMDMNEKRLGISNSSVILNDRIWVIGGSNGKEIFKSVEIYDPQMNIWKKMKSMNEYRSSAAAGVVHGQIFCCGGGIGKNFSKTAECYDPSSDVWTLISDMPGPNAGCGIVVMDAHLIVIGGAATVGKDYLSSVWVLDTADKNAKWIEKELCLSRPLCEFSIAKIDEKILVCGGIYFDKDNSDFHASNDVEIFDGKVWRKGSKMPTSCRNAPAVVIPMEFARYLNE